MKDKRYLLDTSALLAYIEDESGADEVESIFEKEQVILPWPVLMETYYMAWREKGQQEAETRLAMLKNSKAELVWEVNEAFLLQAAKIKAVHRLSFADALIAAYALQNNAVLVHKDPEYEAFAGQLEMNILPYND